MTRRMGLLNASALVGGAFATLMAAAPAMAQETQPTAAETEATSEVEEIVVTGSRIPRNEYTSASPVQVLTAQNAQARGLSDTAQLLQQSTLAAGSPQVTSTISSSFVTDGGPGAATVSLRGLGANRTLVLLNGRRAGPAGTRGGVSAFDLNVLPQSALSRVDILKDGASSIYGSDAVAGVVNLITGVEQDGGELTAYYTAPFEGGGEQMNFSGTFGKTFERGSFSISGDYYKQFEQLQGDRDYTSCAAQYVFDAQGNRADRIDPRTGKPACLDLLWGHVWAYDNTFASLPGRFQYDYDGDLGNYIPTVPGSLAGQVPVPPPGFYLVGYDGPSTAVMNGNHPFDDEQTLIPEVERYTVFAEGKYQLTEHAEAYAEVLLNRRKSSTKGYRQFWNYAYAGDWSYGAGYGYESWGGDYLLSPTPITNHNSASQQVDYARVVGGVRGDFVDPGSFLNDWKWDVFFQYSRSDGDYTADVILKDAVDSQSYRTDSCAGEIMAVSGRTCIDINWADPDFLAGNLTDEQRAFLFDVDKGNTVYEQAYIEGFMGGELFDLPAGPIGAALGFHVRHDEINDVPGEITRSANAWGSSSAGITQGSERTAEIFTELSIPVLKDMPFAYGLDLSLSGRMTNTKTSGSASTYKVGVNWEFLPDVRMRATTGTSFRAPALFELYLADQSSFASQRTVDPCINWQQNLTDGTISQRLADNCANPNGPGGGVPGTHNGAGSSATLFEGGGLGQLEPETSTAHVIGLVWTPKFINFSAAVDYFEIEIEDQVTSLGSRTVSACYLSDNFPTDPVCSQFVRNEGTHRIDTISGKFINIAEQTNRGIDFTARYAHDLPWGDRFSIDGQATWQLESREALFADNIVDTLGEVGNPQFVGNLNLQYERGPWTGVWAVQMIGHQGNYASYGSDTATVGGQEVYLKLDAPFTAFHSFSVRYDAESWSILAGVANLFDELPPQLTTLNLGEFSTVGTSAFTSQYTEGMYGRRGFVRISKSF
ncbi:TonB-dependent receptor [Brevundimonas sp. EAKA]|uniref:Colicin I receptor n=1 Tax=Brevundimonas mediterranea TaxID=74329 RepID=A0A7Z8Y6D2_9CAUL|nr:MULTISPECIES: TonB-dependent receptor [Brevundimonas]KDP93029.1 TonB-dependent receptor [Brevundimonas sp. EAKA]VDC51505.1 Colicin I receptor [Brevundimonas mediterranea]